MQLTGGNLNFVHYVTVTTSKNDAVIYFFMNHFYYCYFITGFFFYCFIIVAFYHVLNLTIWDNHSKLKKIASNQTWTHISYFLNNTLTTSTTEALISKQCSICHYSSTPSSFTLYITFVLLPCKSKVIYLEDLADSLKRQASKVWDVCSIFIKSHFF